MKNIKFGLFFLGLAVAIGGAISVIAQDRVERPRPNVMVLDGRGAQLGVMVSDVDAKEPQGVRIDDVNPDSPADKAGLREGDVVVEYDGERVRSARQFTRLVQETPDGRTVKIGVMRNGQKQTFDATPENRVASNFDFEEYFGAKNGGVLVSSVVRDSAAAQAGLQAGDVITAINGRSVTDQGDLMRELSDASGEVTLTILRDKQEMTLKATLESPERPRNRGSRPGIVM
jgi:S1-C subfamily serine protease